MSQSKVPWVYARVVKACSKLSATQKLIWLEHYGLANGKDGAAWISAKGLGGRLALSRVTVERARQDLLRFSLIRKKDRGAGRTAEWFPQLPTGCRPTAQRLDDDDLERYAEQLDTYIGSLNGEGGRRECDPETGEVTHPLSEPRPVRESKYDGHTGRAK